MMMTLATEQPVYRCEAVNRSRISDFCGNTSALIPRRTCQDAVGFHYATSRHAFEEQAKECSSAHKRKEQCPNNPRQCRPLTFDEYCGRYDQPCSKTSDCLAICFADCYPCNDEGDCEILAAFGVLAQRNEPCFSVYNHTGRRMPLHALAAKLRAEQRPVPAPATRAPPTAVRDALSMGQGATPHLPSMNESLREAATRRGLYMGSQFRGDLIGVDEAYTRMHTRQYSLSTVGNRCKWHATEPREGDYELSECGSAFAYARRAGQAFRGHNLCWGNDNPSWLLEKRGAAELRNALRAHVSHVMRGVRDAAGGVSPLAWDVVNEASNRTSWFKPNVWYPALEDYVDVAFTAARAADNQTLLFYNDFSIVGGGAKADQVHSMIADMIRRGVPIDGVGLQSHLSVPDRYWKGGGSWDAAENDAADYAPAPTEAQIAANIARFGELGLLVHITELDVKCPDQCGEEAQEAQAKVYADVLRACLSQPKVCRSFETWGFTDRYTWLTGARCPTTACHPLPFDEHLAPKKAALRMLAVLHGDANGGQHEGSES